MHVFARLLFSNSSIFTLALKVSSLKCVLTFFRSSLKSVRTFFRSSLKCMVAAYSERVLGKAWLSNLLFQLLFFMITLGLDFPECSASHILASVWYAWFVSMNVYLIDRRIS